MEESDHGALELGTAASVDGGGAECLPDDGLACMVSVKGKLICINRTDVGSDEEGDARAETVALLEELVKHEDNEAGNNELEE